MLSSISWPASEWPSWPLIHLVLAFCGVAVLGVLAVRVGVEVRNFARAVAEGADRIGRAADDLERAAEPLASRAGALRRTGARGE